MIEPFRIAVSQDVLDDLASRLAATRLPPSPEPTGCEDGIDLDYLATLVAHWRDRFDWRVQEQRLNRFAHFRGDVAGTKLHYIHERGRGPAPLPIVLVHGWPDGFNRFEKLIPLLTDPIAHGGDAVDAFDVVVPSLPGYGFSDRLPSSTEFTFDVPLQHAQQPPENLSAAEMRYVAQVQQFCSKGGGYMHIQGTKPWTPATALNDSPAGLAPWIVAKFYDWSDVGGDIESRYSKDELLTNVMLYWVTQTIGTSFLAYRDWTKPNVARQSVETAKEWLGSRRVPTRFALFPKDIAQPPREWAARFFDVRHWSEMPVGGHFAPLEEPERIAQDMRAFFHPLRD